MLNSPLFQSCQVYDKPRFFKKIYMNYPVFHHYYMNGPVFLYPCLKTHIFAKIFSSETNIVIFICKFCLQTAKRVYKIQRTLYEYVIILFNQVYEKVILFEVQVYDWGRFPKIACTSIPKLPPSKPPSTILQ